MKRLLHREAHALGVRQVGHVHIVFRSLLRVVALHNLAALQQSQILLVVHADRYGESFAGDGRHAPDARHGRIEPAVDSAVVVVMVYAILVHEVGDEVFHLEHVVSVLIDCDDGGQHHRLSVSAEGVDIDEARMIVDDVVQRVERSRITFEALVDDLALEGERAGDLPFHDDSHLIVGHELLAGDHLFLFFEERLEDEPPQALIITDGVAPRAKRGIGFLAQSDHHAMPQPQTVDGQKQVGLARSVGGHDDYLVVLDLQQGIARLKPCRWHIRRELMMSLEGDEAGRADGIVGDHRIAHIRLLLVAHKIVEGLVEKLLRLHIHLTAQPEERAAVEHVVDESMLGALREIELQGQRLNHLFQRLPVGEFFRAVEDPAHVLLDQTDP